MEDDRSNGAFNLLGLVLIYIVALPLVAIFRPRLLPRMLAYGGLFIWIVFGLALFLPALAYNGGLVALADFLSSSSRRWC